MNYKLIAKPSIEPYGGSLIDNVLAQAYADIIYAGWKRDKMGEPQNYGGGVIGITCAQLLEACEGSHYKMAQLFPGISRNDAKDIIRVVNLHKED